MQEYLVGVRQTIQSAGSISLLRADTIIESEMECFVGFLSNCQKNSISMVIAHVQLRTIAGTIAYIRINQIVHARLKYAFRTAHENFDV